MPTTTSFAITDSAVVIGGDLTHYGNAAGFDAWRTGWPSEVSFTATGTDCSINNFSQSDGAIGVSVDGGAFTTPSLTINSWQVVPVFSGLSDAAHTVKIRMTEGWVQTTDFVDVTGASPSISLTSGYSQTIYDITTSSRITTDGWNKVFAQSGNTLNLTYAQIRFRATCTSIKFFAIDDGDSFWLYVDGVRHGSVFTLPNSDFAEGYFTFATGLDGGAEHEYILACASSNHPYLKQIMLIGGDLSASILARGMWANYGDSISGPAFATDITYSYLQLISLSASVGRTFSFAPSTTVKDFGPGSGEVRTADITGLANPPERLIVLYGRNDAAQLNGAETANEFYTSYLNMITALATGLPSCKIDCLGILDSPNDIGYSNRSAFNAKIALAVSTYGSPNIRYVNTDGWTAASDFPDDIHPGDTGMVKIAAAYMATFSGPFPFFLDNKNTGRMLRQHTGGMVRS